MKNIILNANNMNKTYYYLISLILISFIYFEKIQIGNFYLKNIVVLILVINIIIFLMKQKELRKIELLWISGSIGLILACINSIDRAVSITYTFFYILGIFLFIYSSHRKYLVDGCIKFIKIYSNIFCAFTILPLISKTIYFSIIPIILKGEELSRAKEFIAINRFPGIGGFLGNNAFLISIGISIYLIEFLVEKKKIKLLNIFIFLSAILMTGSRTMLIATTFSMILCVFIYGKINFRTIIKKVVLVLIIFSMFILFMNITNKEILENIIFRFKNGEASVNTRFIMYNFCIQLFTMKSILGFGPNTFLGLTYLNGYMVENTYAHNVFLQLLAETGLIGTVITLIPFITTYYLTLKKTIKSGSMKNMKWYISLYIQTIFLIYFFVGNPIYDYNMLLVYFISVAMIFDVKPNQQITSS